jgi:hypothetical protein
MLSAPTPSTAATSAKAAFRIMFIEDPPGVLSRWVTQYPLFASREPEDMAGVAHFVAMHISASERPGVMSDP